MIKNNTYGGYNMNEKIIGTKKNGMMALLTIVVLYFLAIAGVIFVTLSEF